MKVSITTLSENTAGFNENTIGQVNFLGEWGLCILVEADGAKVLLDSGQSISATYNAGILGIDLRQIDCIVLSHGHFDHTGGLRPLLRQMGKRVEVIAHPDIWEAKYSLRQGRERYNGIPYQRRELESLGASFKLTRKPVKITENIMTTGEIPLVTDYEQIDPDQVVKEGDGFKPDRLMDDQALIVNTEAGLVVILGCAHRGIINTIYHAQKLTGVKPVHTVLGGCHLFRASPAQLRSTVAALKELGVQRLGVSHCTGLAAAAVMAHEFGDRFFFNNAGTSIKVP